ncbi:hypothetical protein AYO44_17335 [Planctomycetaceae bacterium SCGC AG-212-F19]|nr:hypothetical protein AYO44_17335 [Planctomycetaceae bacterium SCGC AG-212-F19]
MRFTALLPTLALTAFFLGIDTSSNHAAEGTQTTPAFGALRGPSLETVRDQAVEWFKTTDSAGKCAKLQLEPIWIQTDRPIIDLLAETFAFGNPEAKKLLADARDPGAPISEQVPDLIKDANYSVFFRANLGLAYAKALCERRLFDEALSVLQAIKAEQVVDPAAYYFHRAVAEHRTLHKSDAGRSIGRLMDDVADAPERYKMVAALMFLDLQQWKAKDLGDISRQMDVIKDRLDNGQGGPKTRQKQKDVVARLDELIKRYENDAKNKKDSPSCPNDGKCPDGQPKPGDEPGQTKPGPGTPRAGDPVAPMDESRIGLNPGDGKVLDRKLRDIVEGWGKLPEKDRNKAMTELVRAMPPAFRPMIEDYYRKSAAGLVP